MSSRALRSPADQRADPPVDPPVDRRSVAARALPIAALLLLAGALPSCATPAAVDGDESVILSVATPGAKLPARGTFRLMRDSGVLASDTRDPELAEQARQADDILSDAVRDAMDRRGYTLGAPGTTPDLWLGWVAAESQELRSDQIVRRFGIAKAPDDWVDPTPMGTMLVVLLDGRTRELLWRASVSVAIRRDLLPAARRVRLEGHVQRLFATLPG